eukprot:scaffold37354_cov20-Tisochrysis_lutea.AAC.2
MSHLQQVGELGVAEGHVLVLVANGHDDVAQGAQAFVDVLCLLHGLALRPAVLHALAARQVDQVEHATDMLAYMQARVLV